MAPSPAPGSRPIVLRGCRQNNLKGFDLEIPRGAYVVVTGVSGSGKSSLAFDTLFAEGQRRYVESFSAYARQFLERMNRPAIDGVEGIPPAVAIEQGNAVRSSRSTVGTVTEIHDHVKVLFARAGVRHCDRCDRPVLRASPDSVADELLGSREGDRVLVAFDAPSSSDFGELRAALLRQGFVRVLAGGRVRRLDEMESPPPDGLQVALDRIRLAARERGRLVDALEQGFAHGDGRITVAPLDGDDRTHAEVLRFDTHLRCADCGVAYRDATPGLFTFNNPLGACPDCRGFGRTIEIHPDLVVPDASRSLAGGAIKPWTTPRTARERRAMLRACAERGVPVDRPYGRLREEDRRWLWVGDPGGRRGGAWWGISGWFSWLQRKVYKLHVRVLLSRYRAYVPCKSCGGTRFRCEALRTRLGGRTIAELYASTVGDARRFFDELDLPEALLGATAPLIAEVRSRLRYLCEVGLD